MAYLSAMVDPIEALREQAKALEAEIHLCLDDPDKGAVHRLRTTIRRFEAQMELVGQLWKATPPPGEIKRLRKLLKKLRTIAGNVRDFDVQREFVAAHTIPQIALDARRLRRYLKRRRSDESLLLQDLLNDIHRKIEGAIQKLLDSLHDNLELSLPATQLATVARLWFAHHRGQSNTIDELHKTRKAAKIARYMAEIAPHSAAAEAVAKKLEDLQHAGGQWHDWVLLVDVAAGRLGKKHPLAEVFQHRCNLSLRAYRRRLARLV